MTNYYKGAEGEPYHISVGAVLRNSKGEIACHHFTELAGMNDMFILMRETIEPGESIEDALHRGLIEEFGAKAHIVTYIGSFVAMLTTDPPIQKTTLYFLCDLTDIHESWRKEDDEEIDSVIEWHSAEYLMQRMSEQELRYHQEDLDESSIIKRVQHLVSR